MIRACEAEGAEEEIVAEWLEECLSSGMTPEEVAIIVRTIEQYDRAESAIISVGGNVHRLSGSIAPLRGMVNLATMHVAKGLEFRAVAVMACDDSIVPMESRMLEAGDETELEEVFTTERHLLYVACTRAREKLLVTGVEPVSEFLEDLVGRNLADKQKPL